jgi:hypothetical protein
MLTELQNLSSRHLGEGLKYFLLAPQPVQQESSSKSGGLGGMAAGSLKE